MKRAIIIVLAWMAISPTAQSASFNCAKATTIIEKLICGDADLMKLDDELNKYYKLALGELTEQEKTELHDEQRHWMTEVRDKCNQNGRQLYCLFEAYRSRNAELHVSYKDARTERMLEELPELSRRSGLSIEKIKKNLDECNTGEAAQYGINICSNLYSIHVGIAMDSVLEKKLQQLPPSCREKLRMSQNKWKENTVNDCSKQADDLAEGGSMAPLLANMCLEADIRLRTAQLKSIKSCHNLP